MKVTSVPAYKWQSTKMTKKSWYCYLPNANIQVVIIFSIVRTTEEIWFFGDIRHIYPWIWLQSWSINTLKNKK